MSKNVSYILIALGLAFTINSGMANAQNQGYQYNYPQQNQNYSTQQYYQPAQQQQYNQSYLPPLQGSVVVAPAGTSLGVMTTSSISSAVSRVGDIFSTRLANDLYVGGGMALPAGSTIEGQVIQAESAGRTGKNGILAVRFNSAITPDGRRIPISARIATEDGTGVLKGGSTGGRVAKTFGTSAVGAGIGAALGTALAPAAGGRVGRGAVYGTAIGAGAGMLANLYRKGSEAELPSGTQLHIVLDQPISFQGASQGQSQGYNYNQYPNTGSSNYIQGNYPNYNNQGNYGGYGNYNNY